MFEMVFHFVSFPSDLRRDLGLEPLVCLLEIRFRGILTLRTGLASLVLYKNMSLLIQQVQSRWKCNTTLPIMMGAVKFILRPIIVIM
jgi:hypothetical protein